jgi:hypothetical protein
MGNMIRKIKWSLLMHSNAKPKFYLFLILQPPPIKKNRDRGTFYSSQVFGFTNSPKVD